VHAAADFGLARQMSERVRLAAQSLQDEPSSASVSAVLTRFGGTPFYIAPEVSLLEPHHHRAASALSLLHLIQGPMLCIVARKGYVNDSKLEWNGDYTDILVQSSIRHVACLPMQQ
jgi:serine/threonine protein kinase